LTGPTTTVTSTTTLTGPTTTVTSTATATQTTTSTVTNTSSVIPGWAYGAMAALLLIGLAVGYVVKRPPARPS
jgi:hypothetical protein